MCRDLLAPQQALNGASRHLEDLIPVTVLPPHQSPCDLCLLTVVILGPGVGAAPLLVDVLVLRIKMPFLGPNAFDENDHYQGSGTLLRLREAARVTIFVYRTLYSAIVFRIINAPYIDPPLHPRPIPTTHNSNNKKYSKYSLWQGHLFYRGSWS